MACRVPSCSDRCRVWKNSRPALRHTLSLLGLGFPIWARGSALGLPAATTMWTGRAVVGFCSPPAARGASDTLAGSPGWVCFPGTAPGRWPASQASPPQGDLHADPPPPLCPYFVGAPVLTGALRGVCCAAAAGGASRVPVTALAPGAWWPSSQMLRPQSRGRVSKSSSGSQFPKTQVFDDSGG